MQHADSPKLDLNNTVVDSVIADVTSEFHGCLGVWGGYNRRFTFSHNEICRVAYGGVSLGWGWAIPWQDTFQRENEISYPLRQSVCIQKPSIVSPVFRPKLWVQRLW